MSDDPYLDAVVEHLEQEVDPNQLRLMCDDEVEEEPEDDG